jgi:hypothetical protein
MGFVSPYQKLAQNIGAYTSGKTHLSPEAWGFATLSCVPMLLNGSLSDGLDGSTYDAAVILPQFCKIPKVAVAYSAVDVFTTSSPDTINFVVDNAGAYNATQGAKGAPTNPNGAGTGFQASYTPGVAQTVAPPDTSQQYGYPTEFAAVGDCLFAADLQFNANFFTNPGAGTGGGSQVFETTNWDGCYAAGTVLSMRSVTTASTGSVSNLCVVLLIQTIDDYPANSRGIPVITW